MSSNIILVKGKPKYKTFLEVTSSIGITLSLLLLIIWLFRHQLNISQYGLEIIIGSLLIFTFSRIINIDFEKGIINVIISLLYRLGSSAFYVTVILFIFGFLGLEREISSLALPLFISSVILVVIPYSIEKLEGNKYSLKPKIVKKGLVFINEKIKMEIKEDSLSYEIKKGGRRFGIAILNDVQVIISTDIGNFKTNFKSPVLLISSMIRIKNGKIKKESKNAENIVKNTLKELIKERYFEETKIRLPFISVEEDSLGTKVKVGPIEVTEEGDYEEVKIGPFIRIRESRRPTILIYSSNAKIKIKGKIIQLKEDNKRLSYDGNVFNFSTNGDSLRVDEKSVILKSSNFEISATKNEMRISYPDFLLSIKGNIIKFYSKGKRLYFQDEQLALKLIDEITKKINEQIINIMEGFPLDVIEIINTVEKIFENHKP